MKVLLEEREVEVQGRRVRYRVAGSGRPLVFVHGLGGSTRWWRPVLPALASRHGCHLVDLPGFGAMRGGRRLGLPAAAEWMVEWLRAVDLDRAAVVGHSMGAALAVRAAALEPARIARLVLIAPAGVARRPSIVRHALPMAAELRRARPRFLATLGTDALRAGPRTLVRSAWGVLGEDLTPDLARVEAPTLVILGARDRLIPLDVGARLRRELPDVRVVVLDRSGHVPMFDEPERVAEAVLDFVA
jgi:pimeloyl-ACP methyl ester carboxylesterase